MDVVGDSGTRGLPEIPAEVEPARAVDAVQRVDRVDGEAVDLERLLFGELTELADVTARRDHEVPGRVRVLVQERERGVAEDDEQRLVRGDGACGFVAEHAPDLLARLLDVLESPRRPQGLRHGPFLPLLARRSAALVHSSPDDLRPQARRRRDPPAPLGVLGIVLFGDIWSRIGIGAAIVVVFGGLLFFVWRTDKKDKERRAGIDELPPV